jgi:hypothetical protein
VDSSSYYTWIFVVIVIFAAAICGTYYYAKRFPPASGDPSHQAGVGGWLLVLVVGLIFLGPFMGFARINSEFTLFEYSHSDLIKVEAWSKFKSATWWTFLFTCCLSIYAGLDLAKSRELSAVKHTKVLLWVIGPVTTIIMGIIIPVAVIGKTEVDPKFIGSLIGAMLVSAIWTAYLSKSRRVMATYGATQAQEKA